MSKPDLKQIKQDMEEGKIVSKSTWADVIAYAVELEEFQTLQRQKEQRNALGVKA